MYGQPGTEEALRGDYYNTGQPITYEVPINSTLSFGNPPEVLSDTQVYETIPASNRVVVERGFLNSFESRVQQGEAVSIDTGIIIKTGNQRLH